MSASDRAFLGGGLARHARGRTLTATFEAEVGQELPTSGALFVLGKEFQAVGEHRRSWLEWATTPGRALVILPPFDRGLCEQPVPWEARTVEALAGGETGLGRSLARERAHEIRGRLLALERAAGQMVTAGWRKHPTAGLVVITALPVWSLTALDHRDACRAWLDDLMRQAGAAPEMPIRSAERSPDLPERAPTQDEWTMLLHLCTGPFPTNEAALEALARSNIHTLPAESAAIAINGLAELQFVESGNLTGSGERALLAGPYSAYARALRRRS